MKIQKILLLLIILLAVFLIFFKIESNPPGLYIDEASIGHNAYKILTTGKDEYGVAYPLWFRSFGDYKMPVYIYSVAGAMAIFGKNEFAIRFPSAFAGVIGVIIFYFFIKNLLELDKTFSSTYKKYLPLLAALLLAISSWHIHFSRGGFEVNLALSLYLLGALLFVLFARKKKMLYLLLGIGVFLLSVYTYHSFRIIAPLTVFISLVYFYTKFTKYRKLIISAGILFVLGMIPVVQFSLTKEGSERFAQTSAFSEYEANTTLDKIFVYPLVYLKNFLSFFSINFLFSNGDGNGRHQIATFGLFYIWQFIFLLIGIYTLLKKKKSYFFYVLLGMLLLAIIPAALSRPSPHSLRSLLMMMPLITFIAIGVISVISSLKKHVKVAMALLVCIMVLEFIFTAHFYSQHYPKINLMDWGAGYKDIVLETSKVKDKYSMIVIDRKFSDIKTYYDFYAEDVKYTVVDDTWIKPEELGTKPVLYVRPFYGNKSEPKSIKNIIFPNVNQDVFAQFWVL